MTDRWRYILFVWVIAVALFMSGCASTPKPRTFTGHFTVATNVNPDHQGRPSPVVVKIYHLKKIKTFQAADFFSLYDKGKKVLGDDLIFVEERELHPGLNYYFSTSVAPKAQYVAVIAEFRDIEKSQWRVVTKVPKKCFFDFLKRRRTLHVDVIDRKVSVDFIKKNNNNDNNK